MPPKYINRISLTLLLWLVLSIFCARYPYKKPDQTTLIFKIKKAQSINGKALSNDTKSIVYTLNILTIIGKGEPIMTKEQYYLFEDKEDQENPPYKFNYADGSEEDRLNAIKEGEVYTLKWQKMPSKSWSDTTNSIHIEKSKKHPHTNSTFIHPADGISQLAGCKSLCLQSDLSIDKEGNVKVKNGNKTAKKAIKDIRKLYDALKATKFELWYIAEK